MRKSLVSRARKALMELNLKEKVWATVTVDITEKDDFVRPDVENLIIIETYGTCDIPDI